MEVIELSIIMPCLDEKETLQQCIENAHKFLTENDVLGEIVIGDNGSTDGSIEIAESAGARVVHVKEKGYGAACTGAIKSALGKYIIMGDSDLSYDFYRLTPFLEKLREGYDLVMGNRFKGGIKDNAMPFKNRYLGNPILSLIGRVLFSSDIGDFHCGLRGFSKEAFSQMNLHTPGMEFASELVFKAQLMKMEIAEVPTTLSPDGRSRKPHLRPWRDGWRHLRLMLLFSPNYLFLFPGLVAIGIGLIAMLLISLRGPVSIADIHFSNSTLVFAAGFIIAGLQAVLFGLLAKYYAAREGILPDNPKVSWFFSFFTVEKILSIGCVLFTLGLLGSIKSISIWSGHDFGNLVTIDILSIVVPAVIGMICGIEIILFGLFVGTLQLKKI